jgi:hypothetical protein
VGKVEYWAKDYPFVAGALVLILGNLLVEVAKIVSELSQ